MQVRLEGTRLMVQYDDGKSEIVIDPDYRLGTVFDVKIVAAEGRVSSSTTAAEGGDQPVRVRLVLQERELSAVEHQQGRPADGQRERWSSIH